MSRFSDELVFDLIAAKLQYKIVYEGLGMTEEQAMSPNAGSWILEEVKNARTAWELRVALQKRFATAGSTYKPNPRTPDLSLPNNNDSTSESSA